MLEPTFPTTLRTRNASDLKTAQWTHGTTTELAIFPPGSSFTERNFAARVSTATVENDCPFTCFEGFRRILVLLSGKGMTLTIDGTPRELEPLKSIEFEGAAPASAALRDGPIRDFNVIFRPDVTARVQHVRLTPVFKQVFCPSARDMQTSNSLRADILWCPEQPAVIECGRSKVDIAAGDVFQVEHDSRAMSLLMRTPTGEADCLVVHLALPLAR